MKTLELRNKQGTPLPKSFVAVLKRMIAAGAIGDEYPDGGGLYAINRYTGVRAKLCPTAYALFTFIVEYRESKTAKVKLNDWHNARHVFQYCWSDDYYTLLD